MSQCHRIYAYWCFSFIVVAQGHPARKCVFRISDDTPTTLTVVFHCLSHSIHVNSTILPFSSMLFPVPTLLLPHLSALRNLIVTARSLRMIQERTTDS